eukprot:3998677-Amphidinium_carterae.2
MDAGRLLLSRSACMLNDCEHPGCMVASSAGNSPMTNPQVRGFPLSSQRLASFRPKSRLAEQLDDTTQLGGEVRPGLHSCNDGGQPLEELHRQPTPGP